MIRILAIATNTFRELVRNKLFYNLALFALALIVLSGPLSTLTIGQYQRLITDICLSAMHLVGVLVAILVGVSLVAGELERRTVYVVLAKPIARWQFLLGKYLGLCAALGVDLAMMTLAMVLVLWLTPPGWEVPAGAGPAVILIFVELIVLSAFALLFSSFSTATLGATLSIGLFVIGHLQSELVFFGSKSPFALYRALVRGLHYLLPNLELFNLKSQAAHGQAVPAGHILQAAGYGALYATALFVLAAAIFQRRDLK